MSETKIIDKTNLIDNRILANEIVEEKFSNNTIKLTRSHQSWSNFIIKSSCSDKVCHLIKHIEFKVSVNTVYKMSGCLLYMLELLNQTFSADIRFMIVAMPYNNLSIYIEQNKHYNKTLCKETYDALKESLCDDVIKYIICPLIEEEQNEVTLFRKGTLFLEYNDLVQDSYENITDYHEVKHDVSKLNKCAIKCPSNFAVKRVLIMFHKYYDPLLVLNKCYSNDVEKIYNVKNGVYIIDGCLKDNAFILEFNKCEKLSLHIAFEFTNAFEYTNGIMTKRFMT